MYVMYKIVNKVIKLIFVRLTPRIHIFRKHTKSE